MAVSVKLTDKIKKRCIIITVPFVDNDRDFLEKR